MRRLMKMTGKGKEKVGESSTTQGGEAPKRRRVGEDEVEEDESVYVGNPTWDSGPLSSIREELQAQFFIEKMNKLQNKKEGFVCEKEVPEKMFKPWGIIDKFKALGWEATLKCYDGTKKLVYMNEIEEWVSTLKLMTGNTHNQTKLVGSVNGVTVTMSFSTLNQIAKFDTKGTVASYWYPHLDDLYHKPDQHPQWYAMLQELFLPNTNFDRLHREDLKLKPKLLHLILQHNIMPRRGDKAEVRFPEVPVLYALMKGEPLISFRYLVMYNIWLSRESHERKIVPHCRLIAALLKKAGVITNETVGVNKRFMPFDIKNLGVNWVFGESSTHMVLTNIKKDRRWGVPKNNEGTNSGDEREVEPEPERYSDEEDERVEESGPSGALGGRARASRNLDTQPLEGNWAYQGSTDDVIRNARPSSYGQWPDMSQLTYDHMTRIGASQERALKEIHDRHELWGRSLAYAQQREVNHRYEDDQRRRMHEAWHAGQEVVVDPPIIDYATLPAYDGSVSYPMPPVHHSEWIDPRQDSSQPRQDGGLDFSEFQDTFTSIFGPPQPRYY